MEKSTPHTTRGHTLATLINYAGSSRRANTSSDESDHPCKFHYPEVRSAQRQQGIDAKQHRQFRLVEILPPRISYGQGAFRGELK